MITQVEFDTELIQLLKETEAVHLISIPGIYEILSEHFNNEIIERIEQCKTSQQQQSLF